MLLAIDIGNTNISFGVFRGNKLVHKFNIPTKGYNRGKLKAGLGRIDIDDSIICSVVPAATRVLNRDIKRLAGRSPYIIGKDIGVPIRNLYRKPKQVGSDRLVNAYAGVVLYGAPLVVVDFGTAITFDVVSKDKAYLGGMILPGLGISLDALSRETALLPKIKLEQPWEFIGRDTKSSMLSGIVYGFAGLADNIVKKLKSKIGHSALIIGTGGNIKLIGRYCRGIDKIDSNLTLKGLNLLLETAGSRYA